MSVSPHRKKLTSGRKLQLEQLEARRVFAGLVLDSVQFEHGTSELLATDRFGNTYIAGSIAGTVDLDPLASHPNDADILTARGASDGYVAKYDNNHNFQWGVRFGGESTVNGIDKVSAIRVADGGDLYLTGNFAETSDFGGTVITSNGERDVFVAKLSNSGDFSWASGMGAETNDLPANSLAVDLAGNVIVGGRSASRTPALQYLRQYDQDGNLVWSRDDSGVRNIIDIVTDSQGDIYVAGSFFGTTDFDSSENVDLIFGLGTDGATYQNAYVSKFSSDGTYLFTNVLVPDQPTTANSGVILHQLVVDRDDNVALFGTFFGGNVFLNGSNTTSQGQILDYQPESTVFFVELLPTGQLGSAQTYWAVSEAPSFDDVVAGPNGFYGLVRLKNGTSFSPGPGVSVNAFGKATGVSGGFVQSTVLLKIDEDGLVVDAGVIGGNALSSTDLTHPRDLHIGKDDSIYILGKSTNQIVDYDPNINVESEISTPGNFLLRLHEKLAGEQVVLLQDSFEKDEWNGVWFEDSQNDWFRSTQRSTLGGYSAEVDGSANNATLTTANVIDLTGMESAELTFDWLIESGFDSGEYLSLDVSTDGGTSWTQDVRRLSGNVSAENVWQSEVVDMTPYMTANTKIRFRSKVSASEEDANVDNVRITGIVAGPNSAPVADAGSGYAMNEGSSVMLSGLGSFDPDGTIASYAWDLDGDGQYDDANGVTAIFTTIVSGSHTVGLQVTDNRGATATATAIVSVSNVAPTADAGNDQSLTLGNAASLSASGSTDPGLDIVDYLWDLDNDGLFDDASGVSANFTPAATGSYTIRVQVTDADGATSVDQMQLVVTDVPAETTLFEDSFEVAEWNGLWIEDSQNDWFRSTQRATDGTRSAEVDGLANNATLTMASEVNLSGYASATLTFDWLIESGFDAGEFLSLDISTNGGATWIQDVRRLNGDVSTEDVWHNESVDLSSYASSNLKIRFRSSVSSSTEDANVDNVKIVASNGGNGLLAAMSASSLDAYFADLVKKRKV